MNYIALRWDNSEHEWDAIAGDIDKVAKELRGRWNGGKDFKVYELGKQVELCVDIRVTVKDVKQ